MIDAVSTLASSSLSSTGSISGVMASSILNSVSQTKQKKANTSTERQDSPTYRSH